MNVSRRPEPRFYRQIVDYPTLEKPGTVIVTPRERYLRHVQDGGTAMRYGVRIGRSGFDWSGRADIAYKREWSVGTPSSDMIARQPMEKWGNGQPPGISNPLGARTLYIHRGNRDTLYRLHGTGEVHTIGKAISSGCVCLLHQDIIDLQDRVRSGSTIVVTAWNGYSLLALRGGLLREPGNEAQPFHRLTSYPRSEGACGGTPLSQLCRKHGVSDASTSDAFGRLVGDRQSGKTSMTMKGAVSISGHWV